jgi:hypothetical protein
VPIPAISTNALRGLYQLWVKGALDAAALTQAAAAQGCTVAELISGLEAAQGATTAAMAAGRVSQAVGFAKSIMMGVTQLEGAGVLTTEVLASGAVASGEVAAGAAGTGVIGTVAGWLGVSAGTVLVGSVLLGAAIIGGTIWYTTRSSDATPPAEPAGEEPPAVVVNVSPTAAPTAGPTLAPTCAPLVKEARLCPWSPKNAEAKACGPGFCWDGGFNGSLACKQETLPANAVRIDLSGVKCEAGYTAQTNVCTGVVTACVRK